MWTPTPGSTRVERSAGLWPAPRRFARVTAVPSAFGAEEPQVSILDGDQALAHSLARMLQEEGFAARAWSSAREFMAQSEPPFAGCVIANATLADMTGLELQRSVRERQWPLPVILLISANDVSTAVRGMKAGAINCLPTPVERGELLEAVHEAFAESRAVRARRAGQLRVQEMLERLTPREREVLDLAVTGLLVKQIAARLGTAVKTVKTHKGRLMRKMQVRSTPALMQLMIAAGLSPVPSLNSAAASSPRFFCCR